MKKNQAKKTLKGYACPDCEQGVVHAFVGPFITESGGQSWTVPGVEQETCDKCALHVITPKGSAHIDAWLDATLESISPKELKRFLQKYSLTQKQASDLLGIGEKSLSRWIRGHQRVSTSMSRYIRLLLENSESFEQLKASRREKTGKLNPVERDLLTEADYTSLQKLGLLPTTRKRLARHEALCKLTKFGSLQELDAWGSSAASSIAAFKDTNQQYSGFNGALWIRLGMLAAEAIPCARYDREQVEIAADHLRRCTQKDPAEAYKEAEDLLSRAGVALVVMPILKKSAYRGCTKLLTPEKAVIVHSLKFKSVSQFWRTLFHEIAHLVLHIKSPEDQFLEYDDRSQDPREQEADAWAEEMLVHGEKRITLLARHPDGNPSAIKAAADELGIAPAILVESVAEKMPDKQKFYAMCTKADLFPRLSGTDIETIIARTKACLGT